MRHGWVLLSSAALFLAVVACQNEGRVISGRVTVRSEDTLHVASVTLELGTQWSALKGTYRFEESLASGAGATQHTVMAVTDSGSAPIPVLVSASTLAQEGEPPVVLIVGTVLTSAKGSGGTDSLDFSVRLPLDHEGVAAKNFSARARVVPRNFSISESTLRLVLLATSGLALLLLVGIGLLVLAIARRAGLLRRPDASESPETEAALERNTDIPVAGLREELATSRRELLAQVAAFGQALEGSRARMEDMLASQPGEVAKQVDHLLAARNEHRDAAERAVALDRFEADFKDLKERQAVLEIAQRTRTLIDLVKPDTAALVDLKRKYTPYVEAAQSADRVESRMMDLRGETDAARWQTARGALESDIERLRARLEDLDRNHRIVAFCKLLDDTDAADMKLERLELMRRLGVEEVKPTVGERVADLGSVETVSVSGEGPRVFVARLVAPGYRVVGETAWLQKPRVALEQRS